MRNWIIASVIIIAVLGGGYFVSTNVVNKTETTTPTTTQEQVKTLSVNVTIDYAGEVVKPTETSTVTIDQDATAWDAVQKAVGIENIDHQDYGGDLGIFVTGINGVKPAGNKFWLFKINGEGANVGVSSYTVVDGDKIEFVISEPSGGQ